MFFEWRAKMNVSVCVMHHYDAIRSHLFIVYIIITTTTIRRYYYQRQ